MDDKVQLLIKVPGELKDEFKQACKDNDTSVSREVRKFMKTYVEMQTSMSDTSYDS
jgi:hypothetical protein